MSQIKTTGFVCVDVYVFVEMCLSFMCVCKFVNVVIVTPDLVVPVLV